MLGAIIGIAGSLLGGGGGGGGGGGSAPVSTTVNNNTNNYGSLNPFVQTASKYFNANNLQQLSNDQSQAFGMAQNTYGLTPASLFGPGGMSVGFGGGTGASAGSSPLGGAFGANPSATGEVFDPRMFNMSAGGGTPGSAGSSLGINLGPALSNAFGNYSSAAGSPLQGTQGLLQMLLGGNAGAGAGASGLMGMGFGQLGNPLIGQAFGASGNAINNAGSDFTNALNGTYQNLLQQLQRPEQLAQSGLNDSLFQRGMLGTTGGGLQTEAFARGLGEANTAAYGQAFNAALGARNSDLGAANTFSNIGNTGLGIGNSLLSNAFSQFNNTSAIGGNLANSIFNQNLGINNAGISGANTLNNMGINNFKSLLDYMTANTGAAQRAAGLMGNISTSQNFMPGNMLGANLFNVLGNGQLGSTINGVGTALNTLFGNGASGPGTYDPSAGGILDPSNYLTNSQVASNNPGFDPSNFNTGVDTSTLLGSSGGGDSWSNTDWGNVLGSIGL